MSCAALSHTLQNKHCRDGPRCVQGPQGPPGLPCDMDWGVVVMDYIRSAVVGIAVRDGDGDVLGRGFWVSNTLIATSWSLLDRERLGVRVIVDLSWGQSIPLDGVVVYAVPVLDIAFVLVNPALVVDRGYTPRVLTLESFTRAGTRVVTTCAPGSFVTGFVSNASVGTYGYISDVTTSFAPHSQTLIGAPIIHAYTYSIVGMVQYVRESDGVSGGVCSQWLAAAIGWAGQAPACALYRHLAVGPLSQTLPTLRSGLALGAFLSTSSVDLKVCAPLVTEAVRPQLLSFPLGDTAKGAWIYDPVLEHNDLCAPYGTAITTPIEDSFLLLGPENAVTYADTIPSLRAIDVNYVRENRSGVFSSILSPKITVNAEGYAAIPISDIFIKASVDPCLLPANENIVTGVYVSALGFLVFETAGFPVNPAVDLTLDRLTEIIENPDVVYADSRHLLFAAPFACVDFRERDALNNFALDVYVDINAITKTSTVQWTSNPLLNTADPVSFQVEVRYDTIPDTPSAGEITFIYDVTSGAWANNTWLTATSLTSNPVTKRQEIIRVDAMPVPNDVIYFGVASQDATLYMPHTIPASTPDLTRTVVCPARRTATPDVRGTIVTINVDGDRLYAAAVYNWRHFDAPLRLTSVNTLPVGEVGVDNVVVSTTEVYQRHGSALGYETSALLTSAASFGSPSTTWTVLTTTSIHVVIDPVDVSEYKSVLMTLPALGNNDGTYYQKNFTAVAFSVRIPVLESGNLLFIMQLAATNSTALHTQFAADGSTCLVVYQDGPGNYYYTYRNGYGGGGVSPTPLTITPVSGELTVSGVLTYSYAAPRDVTQRVNALIVGRPPRAGNSSFNDPVGSAATRTLVGGIVSINPVRTLAATMASVATTSDTQYAITTQSGLSRPLPQPLF